MSTEARTLPSAKSRRRAIGAMMAGNFLENYDFTVYAVLATVIGVVFFPAHDPIVSLLGSLSVFAVAFLARPLGAIVFGRMADKAGRRPTLLTVLLLMGVGTFAVGLLPSFEVIGTIAPVLLIIIRVLQGLSMGGEFGTSASYLVEFAPPNRRGLYGSLAYTSATLGGGVAVLFVFGLSFSLGSEAMVAFGWRIPFLAGLPLVAVGIWMRLRLEESPIFSELENSGRASAKPVAEAFRSQWGAMLKLVGVMAGFAVASYIAMSFTISYSISILGYDPTFVYLVVGLAFFVGSGLTLLVGSLSDRWGRKRFMVASMAGLVVLSYPIFLLFALGPAGMVVGQLLLWCIVALFTGVAATAFSEMFPARVRASGFNIAYSVGQAAFSGTAALVGTALVAWTGNAQSPAWYLVIMCGVSLAIILSTRDHRTEVHNDAPAPTAVPAASPLP